MPARHELEVVYPREKIGEPLLCRLAREHGVVFDLHRATVSKEQGALHLHLLGDGPELERAEAWLRDQGLAVRRLAEALSGEAPPDVPRAESGPDEGPPVTRKLWLTFGAEQAGRPILWEIARRFGVDFDVRQASIGRELAIVGLLLQGPDRRVDAACAWLAERGVEVEPIEKSVVEG